MNGLRAAHIAGFKAIELKPGSLDKRANSAIEMTTPTNTLPDRRQTILPPHDIWIGCPTVLDKQQMSTWLEYTVDFAKRTGRIWNAA